MTAPPGLRPAWPPAFWYRIAALLLLIQAISLMAMGRVLICDCGYIRLFEPGVNTAGNSQHLADWYTPSHFLHGVLFFLLTSALFRHHALAFRFAFAVLLEAGWEILENTPMVIAHYRNETMALGYSGDSVLNSVMDSVFMGLGFFFAARMPVRVSVLSFLLLEIGTLIMIRDNLSLNILMLTWPVEAVKTWQAAGG